MTIAAGFVVADGILLCADTLWSDGNTKEYRDKIFSWDGKHSAVCMAVAGNSDNARLVVDECREALGHSKKHRLTIQDVLGIIRPIIRAEYDNHVDSRLYEERMNAAFSILTAAACDGQSPRLFVSTGTSVAPVDRFECNWKRQAVGALQHPTRVPSVLDNGSRTGAGYSGAFGDQGVC
jgi:hypothetical protein